MDPQLHTVTGWPDPGRPAHAARPRPASPRPAGVAVAAGVLLLAALGVGARACLGPAGPSGSTPGSASLITITPAIDMTARQTSAVSATARQTSAVSATSRRP